MGYGIVQNAHVFLLVTLGDFMAHSLWCYLVLLIGYAWQY